LQGCNQRVYTFEDDEWVMRGRYNYAVEADEDLVWSTVEDEKITRILVVSGFDIKQIIRYLTFFDLFLLRTHLVMIPIPPLLLLGLPPLLLSLVLCLDRPLL
jgi:hypothetical protein